MTDGRIASVSFGPLRTDEFHRDPYPIYQRLRDLHPLLHDEERDVYVITRFADVADAARNHASFAQDPGPDVFDRMTRMDPPRHNYWRALTAERFHPRSVAKLEAHVREVTRELLEAVLVDNVVDVVRQFAGPIPSTIVGDLIGVPREYNERFQELSPLCIAGSPDIADAANQEIYSLFEPLIEARRHEPKDDIISILLSGLVDGQPLTLRELLGYCLHLVVAGNDTTTNLIGTGVYLLATHPHVRAMLVNSPALIPQAIEEMLRYDGPVQMLTRRMVAPVELHGLTIPSGGLVELYWGAANRDERQFSTPDVFDMFRSDQRHLGFGHGVHFCLGAHLARLEARVAFEELLARAPEYRLVENQELTVKPGWAIRGFEQVLIELT